MLELRPTCENCQTKLPPHSREAMICSFECTYCAECVRDVLQNVCPNCGGGFCQRPVRPNTDLVGNTSLAKYPASSTRVHKTVDPSAHQALVDRIAKTPPEAR